MILAPITDSTNIKAIGYDAATGLLVVRFAGGSAYRYESVPQAVHDDLMAAPSKGGFVARYVAHNKTYAVRKLTADELAALDAEQAVTA